MIRPRFIAALCIAAGYQLWLQAQGVWKMLTDETPKVSAELKLRRLAVCHTCPIFESVLRTCGSPLINPARGCFCQMDVKAGLKGTCWATENEFETFGWKGDLNT